jgi:hypothetical protein
MCGENLQQNQSMEGMEMKTLIFSLLLLVSCSHNLTIELDHIHIWRNGDGSYNDPTVEPFDVKCFICGITYDEEFTKR